jgi:hypothetical protein
VAAAGIAIKAQLRADQQRLRAKVQGDVLGRLLKAIEEERRRAAEGARRRQGEYGRRLGSARRRWRRS